MGPIKTWEKMYHREIYKLSSKLLIESLKVWQEVDFNKETVSQVRNSLFTSKLLKPDIPTNFTLESNVTTRRSPNNDDVSCPD